MGIVYDVGINDMPRGWRVESEWNKRVYSVWVRMIQRCYSEKYQETHSTYKRCTVADRWLTLSNFVEDIVKIDNYEYWLSGFGEKINPYQLDKDIKSNGQNKCYCLEQCQFVSHAENTRQATLTRDNTYLKGENNPYATLVDRFDKQGNYIDTKYQFEYVQMGFTASNISACCKGRRNHTGGYIFKYHEDK